MNIENFDYNLPEELIAQEPLLNREDSRLLIFHNNEIFHGNFKNVIDYMNEGDVLVLNDSRVIPAKIYGEKKGTGGKIELLLMKELEEGTWKCLAKPSRRIKPGNVLTFGKDLMEAKVTGRENDGSRILTFLPPYSRENLFQLGEMPLPPYIKKPLEDRERYQTVYSRERGSIAAPTAGLHFTEELMEKIRDKGVIIAKVTLHVGLGTFRPVKTEEIEDHKMEEEYFHITEETAKIINEAKERGSRIIAVGTTSTRTLESAATEDGKIRPLSQKTGKFIYPGYRFKIIDGLITNFHLPKSTLFMLVSAFIGLKNAHMVYEEAIKLKYRFYSLGDACFFTK